MYYYICSSKRGQKDVTQLFSRKIEISSSREKHAPTRPCGAFEGVKIHRIGLGSWQKSTQLRHSYRAQHLFRRIRGLSYRPPQLLIFPTNRRILRGFFPRFFIFRARHRIGALCHFGQFDLYYNKIGVIMS